MENPESATIEEIAFYTNIEMIIINFKKATKGNKWLTEIQKFCLTWLKMAIERPELVGTEHYV